MAPLFGLLRRLDVGGIADAGVGAITGAANTAIGAITTAAAAAPSALGDVTSAAGGAAGAAAGAVTNSIEAQLKSDLKQYVLENPWIWISELVVIRRLSQRAVKLVLVALVNAPAKYDVVVAILVFLVFMQFANLILDIYHACNCCWHCCKCVIPRRHRAHLAKTHGQDWNGCDPTYFARFCGRIPLKQGLEGRKEWKWYGHVSGPVHRTVEKLRGRAENKMTEFRTRRHPEEEEKPQGDPFAIGGDSYGLD